MPNKFMLEGKLTKAGKGLVGGVVGGTAAIALILGLTLSPIGDCAPRNIDCGHKCKRLPWYKGTKCQNQYICKDGKCNKIKWKCPTI